MEVMGESEGFANTQEQGEYSPRPEYRPVTKFEKRGETWGMVFGIYCFTALIKTLAGAL